MPAFPPPPPPSFEERRVRRSVLIQRLFDTNGLENSPEQPNCKAEIRDGTCSDDVFGKAGEVFNLDE